MKDAEVVTSRRHPDCFCVLAKAIRESFVSIAVASILALTSCMSSGPTLAVFGPTGSRLVTEGQSATFSVTATGNPPLTYQWWRDGSAISGATGSTFSLPKTTLEDDGSKFQVVVSDAKHSVSSLIAVLHVQMPPDVATFHNDNARTGQNLRETFLTQANVNSARFGLVNFLPVDGKVVAQPLFLGDMKIGQTVRNMLYVATEHDSVYGFDTASGATVWEISLLGASETTSDDRGCAEAHSPEIGVTATPVIDRTRGPHGTLYVQSMSKDAAGNYHQRLHALDLVNGAELPGSPAEIQASYPGTGDDSIGGVVVFDPKQYFDRSALLLSNGVVYTSWASHCDSRPYTGWIIGYDANTLAQTKVLNITPNGSSGAIWMAGSGPAADEAGNIYVLDANGTFDPSLDTGGFPVNQNFGNCFLKISANGQLAVTDYFTMFNTVEDSDNDADLGSGGAILLPDQKIYQKTYQLAVGGGKDGTIYVVDRNNMGHFDPDSDTIYQELRFIEGPIFSTPAYFAQTVYYGPVNDTIRAYSIQNGRFSLGASDQSLNKFPYPGTTPSISANGTSDPILWAVENGATVAVLHAYDPLNLSHEFYNSASRDQFGPANKFVTPTIANGRVFVGTTSGVAVFGLLP